MSPLMECQNGEQVYHAGNMAYAWVYRPDKWLLFNDTRRTAIKGWWKYSTRIAAFRLKHLKPQAV